jgi:hypothetical protein
VPILPPRFDARSPFGVSFSLPEARHDLPGRLILEPGLVGRPRASLNLAKRLMARDRRNLLRLACSFGQPWRRRGGQAVDGALDREDRVDPPGLA